MEMAELEGRPGMQDRCASQMSSARAGLAAPSAATVGGLMDVAPDDSGSLFAIN